MPAAGAAPRPFIFVLAGVNGAGKSSVGGALLAEHGLTWFNPDAYARELADLLGIPIAEANGRAWEFGRQRLEAALAQRSSYAFETTLGAHTIPALLARAADSHDVVMVFCGLQSPEQHIARVRQRVAHGGHDIPEDRIRARWTSSRAHLIALLPQLQHLQVFDNSQEAAPGAEIPDPVLLLELRAGRVLHPAPDDLQALQATPAWARAIVQAALELGRG